MIPDLQHDLFLALHNVISEYTKEEGISEEKSKAFFKELQAEVFQEPDEVLSKLQYTAQRLWTSNLKLCNGEIIANNEYYGTSLTMMMYCRARVLLYSERSHPQR